MRYRKREEKDVFDEINVIPLIDIALVLLIIFMLTATIIVAGTGVNIRLPKAETAKFQKQIQLIIFVTKDGEIFLASENVDPETLLMRLKKAVSESEKVVATISADRETKYEKVVEVLDTIRLAGIDNISLAAELKKR